MNTTDLRFGASWTVRVIVTVIGLASVYLIEELLVFIWRLFSTKPDFPPTWYWAVTVLLTAVDVAAMCYVVVKGVQVLLRKTDLKHLMRAAVVLVLLLGALHAMAAYAYSRIPQWDFQDSLFDDLSWKRIPGRISQDCTEATKQSPHPASNVTPSPVPGVERPTSLEEIERIARISDWQTRYNEMENRTAVGWRGWIQDVARHGYYSNPGHRLVTLVLHDPYASDPVDPIEQQMGSRQRSRAVLSYFDPKDLDNLTVGQEVLVCGWISDATIWGDGSTHISISRPIVNALPLPDALANTQIPADFAVEYEAHGCGDGYPCAEYDLRIEAEGNLTFRGYEGVRVTGTHTARIPTDRLKQLVFELQRTEFLAIENLPEKLEGNTQGATIIRAQLDGRNKSIVLPWRGGEWPVKVKMIIGKIEEVSNLQQWVTLVKSP